MEGFIKFKIKPWIRRVITRCAAILPGAIVLLIFGDKSATQLLVWSQVILSIQLPFTIIPLIRITSHKSLKEFQNRLILTILGWICCILVIVLNVWLLVDQIIQNFEILNIGLWILIGILSVIWFIFTIVIIFIPISPKEDHLILPSEESNGDTHDEQERNGSMDHESQPQILIDEEENNAENQDKIN